MSILCNEKFLLNCVSLYKEAVNSIVEKLLLGVEMKGRNLILCIVTMVR